MTSGLERRLEALEVASSGGGGGCERCRGTLLIVEDAMPGAVHSAGWNGEDITQEEVNKHRTERECPRCGRKIDPAEGVEIRVGGRQR